MSKFFAKVRIKNDAPWRYDDETGFLRCTAIINTVGVLTYLRSEYPDLDPTIADGRPELRILVPAEALAEPDSLKSLEGMPVMAGSHTYIDTTINEGEVSSGQVAGAAMFNGLDVLSDLMVTDATTAQRIMLPPGNPDRLEEISSSGLWSVVWQKGVDMAGASYDGIFARIRYNHVLLLPKGRGRAGAAVRVLNERGTPKMETTLTRIKLRNGSFIRVANEDVPAVEADQKATDDESSKNKGDLSKLQETLTRLDEINAQLDPLVKERDQLKGELEAAKSQLDAATSPDAIESAAGDMVEERDTAAKVANAAKIQMTDEQKKLRGHPLRLTLLNALRTANSKPLIEGVDAANEAYVKGLWSGTVEALGVTTKKVDVAALEGQQYRTQNEMPADPRAARAQRLYGPVEAKKA